jgi:1,4-dihydroxy-2-naphthoate octaprenyltransferase
MKPALSLPLFSALVLVIAGIRIAELCISNRNRRALQATGCSPVSEPHFRAMVVVHVAVLAGALVEAWSTRRPLLVSVALPSLALLVGATALRWWVIASLGAHWNVAVMDSIGGERAVVTRGPYAHVRHPNYVAVFVELLALPLVHAAWLTAVVGSLAHVWVLHHRIRIEEAALSAHPSYRAAMVHRPRFVPRPLLTAIEHAWNVVRLGRPRFLLGGATLYALGVAASPVHVLDDLFWTGLASVLSLQLMTHYSNDYFDADADRTNTASTRWSGGSRVLVEGLLPRWVGLVAALGAASAGVMLALRLLQISGPRPMILLIVIAALSWSYSAPPVRLHSRGLGELDGALVVAALVPFFAFVLQAPGADTRPLLLAIVPPCCLQFAMLMAVGIPDAEADARAGKRTLTVRLGSKWAWRIHVAATVAAYASVPVLAAAGLPTLVAVTALIPAPIAFGHLARLSRGRALHPAYRPALTFWPGALLIITAAAETAGFILRGS